MAAGQRLVIRAELAVWPHRIKNPEIDCPFRAAILHDSSDQNPSILNSLLTHQLR